jgi:RNA polymerase sigma-70 factor, ECF subfamily
MECTIWDMELPSAQAIRVFSFGRTKPAEVSAEDSQLERELVTFFDTFRDPVLRYVLSFGTSMHDGEEIVQEVFLALFQHLRQRKDRRNLRGWIFRVAHNLALKKRQNNSSQAIVCPQTVTEDQHDPSPNPEEQAWFAQRHRRLLAVFEALPEIEQKCLRLRAEGLRYREIAEVLDISLGNVSLLLTRSLARLSRADGR